MSNYLKAGKGLKNMFIATVGAIICQVLLVIPFPFVNSIAMVATMVFTILNLMGLCGMQKGILVYDSGLGGK